VWYFKGCYTVSDSVTTAGETFAVECDSGLPTNILYAALAIDGTTFLALASLLVFVSCSEKGQAARSVAPWGIWPTRFLALARIVHIALLVSAMVLKDAPLPHNSWTTRGTGFNCLSSAIALSTGAFLGLFGLIWRELWNEPVFMEYPGEGGVSHPLSSGDGYLARSALTGGGGRRSTSRDALAIRLSNMQQSARRDTAPLSVGSMPPLPLDLIRSFNK